MPWSSLSAPLPERDMSQRLLYSVLSICSLAMLLFVAGFICWQFGLALLTGLFYLVASKIMLLAFVFLVLLGAIALCGAILQDVRRYFSRETRVLRKIFSAHTRRLDAEQRVMAQSRQLRYWSYFRRRRLLEANNKKQVRALFTAINQELQAMKNKLPADNYREFRKALRQCHRRADAEAMLMLRERIVCR
jgi:hypothetical protein